MATVPMFAPDGSTGEIPIDKAAAAQQAGFKRAYEMQSPDGKTGYIPQDKLTDAQNAGFKMTGKAAGTRVTGYNSAGQPIFGAEEQPSTLSQYGQALFNPVGSGGHGQGIVGGLEQVGGRAMQAITAPLLHPVDTAVGIGKTVIAGMPGGNMLVPDDSMNQRVQEFQDEWKKDKALALENVVGDVAGTVEGGRVIGGAVSGVKPSPSLGPLNNMLPSAVERGVLPTAWQGTKTATGITGNAFRPTSSPAIVPPSEMAARQLSAAVLPAAKDATNFIQAAQQEVPNVIQYAKRTGNPLNTQLEFSKAAAGYAQEIRDFYDTNVLGPVKNKLVRTTGTGFGSRLGESPDTYSTLGQIDQRIVDLNKQLDAPALNTDDMRRALATKTELQNEVAGLRSILHQNLAQATGLAPDVIADLRQRVGRSYELANDTNAAVTQRMQTVGKAEQAPLSWSQLPSKAVNFATGGPVSAADRAFQRALANFQQ